MARSRKPNTLVPVIVSAAIFVIVAGAAVAYFRGGSAPEASPTELEAEAEAPPEAVAAIPEEPMEEPEIPADAAVEVEEEVQPMEEPKAADEPEPIEEAQAEPEPEAEAAAERAAEWVALVKTNGEVFLTHKGKEVAKFTPGLFDGSWGARSVGAATIREGERDTARGSIVAPDGTVVDSVLKWAAVEDGVKLSYRLTPRADVKLNSLHVSMDLAAAHVVGREITTDGEEILVPEQFADKVHLSAKPMESIDLNLNIGRTVHMRFSAATQVLLQDNRRWGPTFSVRIGTSKNPVWPAGEALAFTLELAPDGGLAVEQDLPVTIAKGPDWVPLAVELDIEKDSALDFSDLRPTGSPAGKLGRVIARKDGRFAFEREPDVARRFYGINFCFSALYLTHDQSDRIAERLARTGYNTLRIHHHEGELISPQTGIDQIEDGGKPTSTSELPIFEAPSGLDDNYAARIRGFLHPPQTGEYVLMVSSDDGSTLFLSTDDDPANKKEIASVDGWTSVRQWDKYATQKSAPIALEAGQKYYIEVVHHEGSGGDHVAVGWSGPGIDASVIIGEYISPFGGGPKGNIVREVWKQGTLGDSLTINPKKMDQLDYLFAALKKQGIYLTTDVYVSRPIFAGDVYPGDEGNLGMDDFKMAVPVNENAWKNWKEFARRLFGHTNPYTGLTWAKDPALGWLSMINEGNFGNFLSRVDARVSNDWKIAWNKWLLKTYKTREALSEAWGDDPQGDPSAGDVPLFSNPYDGGIRGRDLVAFLAETERDMFLAMKKFLRDELGCKALLTNSNGWTNRIANQAARVPYDYVDDHFYIDHPQFIEKSWQLPSRCPNTSPIADGAPGGRPNAFVRLLDKPYTISEYNYSGPGRFRGVGGIITGALAATQDWGVVWRFAYSHSRDTLFTPGRAGYFDMVSDPLNLAAERASICLFLRGDMKGTDHTVAIAMTEDELLESRTKNVGVTPAWHALALVSRVGTFVAERPGKVPADITMPIAWSTKRSAWSGGEVLDVDPYAGGAGQAALDALRRKGWLDGNITDLPKNIIQSETKQLTIDAPRDVMVLDTPRTAGGYAPQGDTIETEAATIRIKKTDATVWVSSIDDNPISESRRLVITHLTDLQNTGTRFAERARQTLLAWGDLPHLVRTGSAEISLKLANAADATVWVLSTSGRRLSKIETTVADGELVVPLNVSGPEGARMIYEVVVE